MDEEFESFVVTNPDLVDEGIDVSGLKTQTDTSPFLLGSIPDYEGIQYSTLAPTKYTDLMRLYSSGLPTLDIPQAAAPVTTAPDTGDGGGGGETLPGFDDPTSEPIIPIEPGTFTAESLDESFAGEEGPITQPVTGGITGDPIQMENLSPIDIGTVDDYADLNEYERAVRAANISGTIGGAPVVSQQLQDQGPTTIEGPLSQVQVPGLDYSQADIDAERLANYKNLPQEQQDPNFWENAKNNFLQTGQDVGNFFKDLGSQGLDITKLAGTTLLNLAGRAAFGIPLLGTALSLLGGAESASGAQQGLVSDQFEEEGVALDDIGRIQQVGLDYDTPENVMAGYSPGETGVRIGDITVGGGTIQESIVDRLADLEKTKNEKYNGSFYDANGNPKLNPDTGEPTTLGAREEALKENLNIVARAAGADTIEDGTTLGPGEAGFLDDPSDLVTLEDQLAEQAAAEQAEADRIEAERRELQEINAAAAREQQQAEARQAAAVAAAQAAERAQNQGGGGGDRDPAPSAPKESSYDAEAEDDQYEAPKSAPYQDAIMRGQSGGGGGGGGGCFLADTLITMADGTTKEVQKVDLGDNVAEGGKVFATGKFLVENLHDYKGIKVSGSHMVNEDDNWVRVEDSKHGKSLGDDEHTVYVFGSENRRILINDILFTDYFETTEQKKLIDNEKDFFNNWKQYSKEHNESNVNILNAS